MTKREFVLTAVALLAAIPAVSQNNSRHDRDDAQRCADLHSNYSGRPIVRAEQALNFPGSEATTLTFNENRNSGIQVTGWDKNEYSVLACKSATGDTEAEAKATLDQVQLLHNGGALSVRGPERDGDHLWNVILLVKAPRSAGLDLSVHNGPMAVMDMAGGGMLRADNGPIKLKDSSGDFTVDTHNGPISYSGRGGKVKLNAHNGPIEVEVAGEPWTGELSGEAINGPIELLLPAKFSSGVEVENHNAPMSCDADICKENVRTNGHHMTLGGSNTVIHLSTQHGPITVQNRKKL